MTEQGMVEKFVENLEDMIIFTDDKFNIIAVSKSIKYLLNYNYTHGETNLSNFFNKQEFERLMNDNNYDRKTGYAASFILKERNYKFYCFHSEMDFNDKKYYTFTLHEYEVDMPQSENFNMIMDLSMLMLSNESSLNTLSKYIYGYLRRMILIDSVTIYLRDDYGNIGQQVFHSVSESTPIELPFDNPEFMDIIKKKEFIYLSDIKHLLTVSKNFENYMLISAVSMDIVIGVCLFYWPNKAPTWDRTKQISIGSMTDTYINSLIIWREFDEIREKTKLVESALDNISSFIYVSDPDTSEIVFVNRAMREAFELNTNSKLCCYEAFQKGLTAPCENCPIDRIRGANEGYVYISEETNPITNHIYVNHDSMIKWKDGRRLHLRNSVDSTKMVQLMNQASIDEMTGAYNKRTGLETLEACCESFARKDKKISLCYLDINDLKSTNDTHGHHYGDVLIVSVAETIRRNIRARDIFCRLGGDEFFIAFIEANGCESDKIMLRITEELGGIAAKKNLPFGISISYGISEVDYVEGNPIDSAIKIADKKMYEQKKEFKRLKSLI